MKTDRPRMAYVSETQEKVDELQVELDSTKLDLEHAQLWAKENEAAAQALRYRTCCEMRVFGVDRISDRAFFTL